MRFGWNTALILRLIGKEQEISHTFLYSSYSTTSQPTGPVISLISPCLTNLALVSW